MEPNSLINDAEFWLPPEFLTDDDFLVEKENKGDDSNNCLFPYEPSHGIGLESGFGSTVTKPIGDEENFLTRKMFQSTPEDDFSSGFCHNHEFPAKAWGANRSPQSTRCGCVAGIGCGHRNLTCQTRDSSQATAWDLCYAAVEELAMLNINGYNNHSSRGLLDLPRKHPLAAAIVPNDGSGYYSHKSLQYQKLQAIKYQQLKQQQLMQQSRGLRVNSNNNKSAGPVDLSPAAWSNQPLRRGSGMRAVFLGDRNGKRRSTGTGVFLPRRDNHSSPASAEKSTLATVLVPARVAQVLNLDESVVHQPAVRSSASLNDVSWRQRSNKMKMEKPVNEPRLPLDWAY